MALTKHTRESVLYVEKLGLLLKTKINKQKQNPKILEMAF